MDKSVHTFPYRYKRIEQGILFNPLVSIPVKTRLGWQPLWFLVDSGADTTMLTTSLADQLGLSYDSDKKTSLYGIGEHRLNAFLGVIRMRFGRDEVRVRVHFIQAKDTTLLLGRLDVFERYTVCFDYQRQRVLFQT